MNDDQLFKKRLEELGRVFEGIEKAPKNMTINPPKMEKLKGLLDCIKKILGPEFENCTISYVPSYKNLMVILNGIEFGANSIQLSEISKYIDSLGVCTGYDPDTISVMFVIKNFYLIQFL